MTDELFTDQPKPIKIKRAPLADPVPRHKAGEINDTVHRHQTLDGRTNWFQIDCHACVKAERTRGKLAREELANAIFLYPNVTRYESLCREWLAKQYPNIDLNHGSALPIWQLASADECLIVCVRPVADVGTPIEPAEIAGLDAFRKLTLIPNDRAKQLAQICASEPLRVNELCRLTSGAAGRIQVSGQWDASELIRRIHEAFAGEFRVHVPKQDHPKEDLVVGPA